MPPVTSERPRRRRRIHAPSTALPRPVTASAGGAPAPPALRRPLPSQPREHHVRKDYGYVRRDLLGIAIVGIISFAFIGVMSFIVQ